MNYLEISLATKKINKKINIIKYLIFLILTTTIFSCNSDACKYDTDCNSGFICSEKKCIAQTVECYGNTECKQSCEIGKSCYCQFGKCISEDPCIVNSCSEHSKCSVIDTEPYYECLCDENFHEEDKNCISNLKTVECKDIAPENGISIVEEVHIIWNEADNSWSDIPNCEWNCKESFHKEENSCISNTKTVACINNTPENATITSSEVEISWNIETKSWDNIPNCEWSCDENYIDTGDSICREEGWSAISRGFNHVCGIKGGALYCWGSNNNGQLGSPGGDKLSPQQVGDYRNWDKISTGPRHSCGIRAKKLYCWGNNLNGELGLGTSDSFNTPKRVGFNADWVDITSYGYEDDGYSCGIRERAGDRTLYCWGKNDAGQLGQGDTTVQYLPQQVGSSTNWLKVTAGSNHVCGIRSDGLYCWGENSMGALGIGTVGTNEHFPKVVSNVAGWKDLSLGWDFTCAIDVNGLTSCWGNNFFGQLGINQAGDGTNKIVPTNISSSFQWKEVSNGKAHVCAVKDDNSLYCWGNNSNFELGLGNTNTSRIPTFVRTNWKTVGSGLYHTCGIEQSGKLFCWGNNSLGQLGVRDKTNREVPTEVIIH